MWPETARILCKGGTAVFWVCPDLNLLVRLFTRKILTLPRYILNSEWHPTHLSTPSSQRTPKAKTLRNFRGCYLLVGVFPKYKFLCANTDIREVERRPLPQPSPIIMRKRLLWDDLYQYLRTWSSLHTFRERYPVTDDISKKLGWFKEGNGEGRWGQQGGGTDRISLGHLVG